MKNEKKLRAFLKEIRKELALSKKSGSQSGFVARATSSFLPLLETHYYTKEMLSEWRKEADIYKSNLNKNLVRANHELSLIFAELWRVAVLKKDSNLKGHLLRVLRNLRNPGNYISAKYPPLDWVYPILRELYVLYISRTHEFTFAPSALKMLALDNPWNPSIPPWRLDVDMNPAIILYELLSLRSYWESKTVHESIGWDKIKGNKAVIGINAHQAFYASREAATRSEMCFLDMEKYNPKLFNRAYFERILETFIGEIEQKLERHPDILKGPKLKSYRSDQAAKFAYDFIYKKVSACPIESRRAIHFVDMVKQVQEQANANNELFRKAVTLTLILDQCREVRKNIEGGWDPRKGKK